MMNTGEVEKKIGCLPIPCATCPYRRDVPSGIWAREEYLKLVRYDAETFQQPAELFMCHQKNNSLCTGWVQSHANRPHAFDLLALRLSRNLDRQQVSKVALMEPVVKLFKSGSAAMRHGLRDLLKPAKKAKDAIESILKKRKRRK